MPAGTLRAWMLGLLWAIVIPGVNQFYFFRFPNITVGPVSIVRSCYLSSSLTFYAAVGCPAADIPSRAIGSSFLPHSPNIWAFAQPWPFHHQGTRRGYNHGGSRRGICLRSKHTELTL